MKAYLLKTDGTSKVVDFEPTLENYYNTLEVRCIDIVERKIGDKYFDIVCDDEGLLVDDPRMTAYAPKDVNYSIFGNILIMGLADAEGKETELTDSDIELIENNLHFYMHKKTGELSLLVELADC